MLNQQRYTFTDCFSSIKRFSTQYSALQQVELTLDYLDDKIFSRFKRVMASVVGMLRYEYLDYPIQKPVKSLKCSLL